MNLRRVQKQSRITSLRILLFAIFATASLSCEPTGDQRATTPSGAPARSQPRPMLAMRVVADNFRWHLRYSGPDGKLDTTDDVLMQRHLHLPANTEISIDLQSKDYVYSFYLPHIALMEVAIPNMPFNLKFETGSSGTFELLGSQMCGYTHPNLLADVVIHAPANFETWLSKVGNGQD